MAYLAPSEFVTKMVDAGESKIFTSTRDTIIRAYMAGAILALAALAGILLHGWLRWGATASPAVQQWPLLAVLALAGGFTLFEALRGWCVMRACGIRTKW